MATEINPPEEFYKIINDFTSDILITFPEYSGIIARWWKNIDTIKETQFVFNHCIKLFPERFFDILYQNSDIFFDNSEVNTEFLPGIVFKQLWACDISDTTRKTIWKYLQLILFAVIGSINNTSELGDAAKLFEAINEDELKIKLQETMENMKNIFDTSLNSVFPDIDNSASSINLENMPSAEDLHNHINSLMGGKLGKFAMELAEETAKDLNLDMDNVSDAKYVFEKLFKNPTKLMSMVKNIGSRLDEKLKSGEIKESELMEEGLDLLNKMKNMPGMDNMQKIFSQMGMGGMAKKMNMGAMESQLNRNMKTAKMKERMREKAENITKMKESGFCNMNETTSNNNKLSDEEIFKIFSTGEKVEKTPRGTNPNNINGNTSNKKQKKNKK